MLQEEEKQNNKHDDVNEQRNWFVYSNAFALPPKKGHKNLNKCPRTLLFLCNIFLHIVVVDRCLPQISDLLIDSQGQGQVNQLFVVSVKS